MISAGIHNALNTTRYQLCVTLTDPRCLRLAAGRTTSLSSTWGTLPLPYRYTAKNNGLITQVNGVNRVFFNRNQQTPGKYRVLLSVTY